MIEAFLEHDTKYVSAAPLKKQPPRVGGSASTSTGEYPPSREHQKLPILGAVDVKKRERLSSRSEVQLHYAGSSSRSSLSSTRSDSDLHAPRRTGSVPSSADRSALDFLDQSDEEEDSGNALAATAKSAGQRALHARSKTSPPDFKSLSLQSKRSHPVGDLDLTSKFDALKQMVKANAKIHGIAAYKDEPPLRRTKADGDSAGATHAERSSSHLIPKTAVSKKSNPTRALDPQCQGIATLMAKATAPVNHSVVPTNAPRLKKELKIHNGVSLSDLKKEHRAALELLQELGGPIDTSEQQTEETTNKVKPTRVSKQSTTTTGHTGSSRVVAARLSSLNHDEDHKAPSPAPSQQSLNHSQSSGKLVAKLRASVPSGRDRYKTQSPELDSPEHEEVVYSSESQQQSNATCEDDPHDLISGSVELEQSLRDADANQAQALAQCEQLSGKCSPEPAQQQALDESWKQYEDDAQQADEVDEEGENNNDDLDPWTSKLDDAAALPRSGMSTARSADLYGDEAFENEW